MTHTKRPVTDRRVRERPLSAFVSVNLSKIANNTETSYCIIALVTVVSGQRGEGGGNGLEEKGEGEGEFGGSGT